jgi:hypothetical protein
VDSGNSGLEKSIAVARRETGTDRPAVVAPGPWPAPPSTPDGCAFTAAVTLDEYLTLVDETGRIVRGDKRGAIPANLAPILDRLRIDLDAWLALMRSSGHFGGGSFGALASRAREALRRGAKWIVNTTAGLYRDDQSPAELSTA